MYRSSTLSGLALAALVHAVALAAGSYPVEFSARMVQTMPDDKHTAGNIYVGKDKVRTEMGEGDKQRIMIMDTTRKVAWMLNPARKEYLKMTGSAGQATGANRPALPGEPGGPCGRNEGVVCKKLGIETVNGRRTEKWEITMSRGQQSASSIVWVDRTLAMPVREELPGGFVRELRNIQVGPQPTTLFQVPRTYKRVEMPAQSGQGRDTREWGPSAGE